MEVSTLAEDVLHMPRGMTPDMTEVLIAGSQMMNKLNGNAELVENSCHPHTPRMFSMKLVNGPRLSQGREVVNAYRPH